MSVFHKMETFTHGSAVYYTNCTRRWHQPFFVCCQQKEKPTSSPRCQRQEVRWALKHKCFWCAFSVWNACFLPQRSLVAVAVFSCGFLLELHSCLVRSPCCVWWQVVDVPDVLDCSSRSRSRSSGSHSSRSFSRSSVSSRSKTRSPEPAPPGVERGDRNYGPPPGRYMWVPAHFLSCYWG